MTLDMSGGGTLSVREDGLRVYLEARREPDGLGLYKVWLTGRGSGRFLLGTLAPEGEGLRLRRKARRFFPQPFSRPAFGGRARQGHRKGKAVLDS